MANSKQLNVQSSTTNVASQSGFTIVELMVSILLTAIIMGAIYSVYRVQTHSAKVQESRLEAQEYARSVLDMMVREIRNAAYNPLSVTNGTNCAGGSAGTPGVITATSSSLRFTYDFHVTAGGGNPDGLCDGPNEDITYQFQAPGPQNCPTGFGDITRTAKNDSGTTSTESLTNCNVTSLSLSYFRQDGSPPTGLTDIQRVLISITVKSLKPDAEFGGQLTVTMTSNADLRNRGLPS
jgi:prepilin-type N-terminal cleavage/methylation domain-containing protein